MRTLANLMMLAILAIGGMVYAGIITTDELKDIVLGKVTMGDTTHQYTEEDFRQVFDLIIGEVEVADTSRTSFSRNTPLCDDAFVVNTAEAVIKYEVKTTEDLFYVNMDDQTYYISDALGVTFYEANRQNSTFVEESTCIKTRDISRDDMEKSRRIAETAFENAVKNSDKIIEADQRFQLVKNELITSLQRMGFTEGAAPNTFLD